MCLTKGWGQVARYKTQQIAGDFSYSSMCAWDCAFGYYRNLYTPSSTQYWKNGQIIPSCLRCRMKPWNAKFRPWEEYQTSSPELQCNFDCNAGMLYER